MSEGSRDTVICLGTEWPPLVKAKDTTAVPLGKGEGFVFVFTLSVGTWSLSPEADWLTASSAESGDGFVSLAFEVAPNSGPARKGTMAARKNGQTVKSFEIHQFGSQVVGTMKELILNPPSTCERGKYPPFSKLIMELGILGKFIAKEIRQAPPVAWGPAVAVAAAAVEAAAGVLIAARLAFDQVPEPSDYFSSNPLPMETLLIQQQAALLEAYITEQVLAGE